MYIFTSMSSRPYFLCRLDTAEHSRSRLADVNDDATVEFGTTAISHRTLKAKFHYAILVADRSDAGRRPAANWNLAYHLAR